MIMFAINKNGRDDHSQFPFVGRYISWVVLEINGSCNRVLDISPDPRGCGKVSLVLLEFLTTKYEEKYEDSVDLSISVLY